MPKRKRKNKLFLRTALYISVASFLFLLVLSIIFYPSLFKKKTLITPVVKNSKTEELTLSKLLVSNDIEFVAIDLASDYFNVKLKDGETIYISLKKDVQAQISSLQVILKQLTISGKRFNLIDFRFDKPVIKYTN